MFERFTTEARTVVVLAVEDAKSHDQGRVGTQHLLLALLARPDCLSARVLARHGLDHARALALVAQVGGGASAGLDPEALRAIGIDLDAVRASVEATFGEGALDAPAGPGGRRRGPLGHVPLSPRSKKVLELSLREAVRLKQGSIGDAHLLLGLLREGQGVAAQVLRLAGIDLADLREELDGALRQAG